MGMQPRLAVAHAGRRLFDGGSPFRHPLRGFLQPLHFRPVLPVFKRRPFPLARLLPDEIVISAGKIPDLSVFQVPDPRAQRPQQRPVMGYQDDSSGETFQLPAQHPDSLPVQVCGGFIRKQQSRPGGQGGRDPVPGHLAAGQAFPLLCRAETRPGFRVLPGPGASVLADQRRGRPAADDSLIRRQFAGKHPQQGGLAGAVFPDQADPFPVIYRQPVCIQYFTVSEKQAEIRRFQDHLRHKNNSSRCRGGATRT